MKLGLLAALLAGNLVAAGLVALLLHPDWEAFVYAGAMTMCVAGGLFRYLETRSFRSAFWTIFSGLLGATGAVIAWLLEGSSCGQALAGWLGCLALLWGSEVWKPGCWRSLVLILLPATALLLMSHATCSQAFQLSPLAVLLVLLLSGLFACGWRVFAGMLEPESGA